MIKVCTVPAYFVIVFIVTNCTHQNLICMTAYNQAFEVVFKPNGSMEGLNQYYSCVEQWNPIWCGDPNAAYSGVSPQLVPKDVIIKYYVTNESTWL